MPTSVQDIVKGFDPTGLTSISPAQLATMVDNATPANDKGLQIVTTDTGIVPDVPNAAVTTKWKTYIWKRQLASSVIAYEWNENGTNDATYLKWQPITVASIPEGAVTTAKLADGSVTNSKVVSVDYSKLTNAPSAWYNIGSAAAGGDLSGNYPNPVVGLQKIDNTKISPNTILDSNITNATISADVASGTASKIKPHTVGSYFLRTNAGATLTEWAKSYFTEIATLGTTGQIPKSDGAAVVWFTPAFTKSIFSGETAALDTVTSSATANYAGDVAHGLGVVPSFVRVVLHCFNGPDGNTGHVTGDEYDITGFICRSADTVRPPLGFSADATNVRISYFLNASGGFKIVKKDGTGLGLLEYAKWKFKVYAAV